MKTLNLEKHSTLPQNIIFKISTDVANFHNIMPKYFKSLKVIKDTPTEKIVLENISFMGKHVDVKTQHKIIHPNIHKIKILTGYLKDTTFFEEYDVSPNGTDIKITISLHLNGILKFIPFIDKILFRKMNSVMNEFLVSAANYARINSLTRN
ncbi:hypothetical protein [Nitrosopumilus sp. S4]